MVIALKSMMHYKAFQEAFQEYLWNVNALQYITV